MIDPASWTDCTSELPPPDCTSELPSPSLSRAPPPAPPQISPRSVEESTQEFRIFTHCICTATTILSSGCTALHEGRVWIPYLSSFRQHSHCLGSLSKHSSSKLKKQRRSLSARPKPLGTCSGVVGLEEIILFANRLASYPVVEGGCKAAREIVVWDDACPHGIVRPFPQNYHMWCRHCPKTDKDISIPRVLAVCSIPLINPWGAHRGQLLDILAKCRVVYLEGMSIAEPDYGRWQELCAEAMCRPRAFCTRAPVNAKHLRFSLGEDLKRTVEGRGKAHEPDRRAMFGISDGASREKSLFVEAGVDWALREYVDLKAVVVDLIARELGPVLPRKLQSPWNRMQGSLGAKLCAGRESWTRSVLRHCLYPDDGTCTEHTDYGVVTLELCNAPGLEVFINDTWQPAYAPRGCALLYAGDMLEILTNGRIAALLHRVALRKGVAGCPLRRAGNSCSMVRQSQILFLQPDASTIVQPLDAFLRKDGSDRVPVRYGDWHTEKVALAFGGPCRGGERRPRSLSQAPSARRSRSLSQHT